MHLINSASLLVMITSQFWCLKKQRDDLGTPGSVLVRMGGTHAPLPFASSTTIINNPTGKANVIGTGSTAAGTNTAISHVLPIAHHSVLAKVTSMLVTMRKGSDLNHAPDLGINIFTAT